MRHSGDYAGLEKLYLQAVNKARAIGNMRAQARYLTALGNTYVYLFRYTDAIEPTARRATWPTPAAIGSRKVPLLRDCPASTCSPGLARCAGKR